MEKRKGKGKFTPLLVSLLLCVCLCGAACPVQFARGSNLFEESLLALSRIDKGVDTFSEVSFQLYCDTCAVHPISKETALAHQAIAAQINKYEQVAFGVLRSAYDPTTRRFSLTAVSRASVESALQAIKALTPSGTDPSIPSDVSLKLQPLLSVITGSVDKLLGLMGRVKSAAGDAVFEVTLSDSQAREVEAAIR